MKSICIKTNNQNSLDYLLNEVNLIDLENVYFSVNQFKNFKNIIIHYKGTNNSEFLSSISSILACFVIDELEEGLLKNSILQNYFYFDSIERNKILDVCFELIHENFTDYFDKKYSILYESFLNYISSNRSIVLNGFINFRVKPYITILDDIAGEAVSNFIIEKEYLEFISLLKLYVNSQKSDSKVVHLIYKNEQSILLDEDKEIISICDEIFKAKYLSDISFSSNDYALNALLTLLPEKLYIHLDNYYVDEFINTIRLVFENRVNICTDCDICKIYSQKLNSISNK